MALGGMNLKPTLSYEDILRVWREAGVQKPFCGHFLFSFVTCTNQIENIDISYNTTRELFESERLTSYTGDLRDIFSVTNNRQVARYINDCLVRGEPVTPELIREVNRLLMFGSIDRHSYEDNGERAGVYKRKDYCVGRYSVGSLPEDVEDDIAELCEYTNTIMDREPAKVASVFQCGFEHVHPFADGNGRTGRWLTNYLLVLLGHPPILFSRESRRTYFSALEKYDLEEDCVPMYAYIKEQTCSSWHALREVVHNKEG